MGAGQQKVLLWMLLQGPRPLCRSSPLRVGQMPDKTSYGGKLGGPHCRAPTRKAGVTPNIAHCSRQHLPLYETTKPGRAADEPLRGVDLLQEVTGETLYDGLHVRGTALHELHHLQHAVKMFNAGAN